LVHFLNALEVQAAATSWRPTVLNALDDMALTQYDQVAHAESINAAHNVVEELV
jgi:hypothetical protein